MEGVSQACATVYASQYRRKRVGFVYFGGPETLCKASSHRGSEEGDKVSNLAEREGDDTVQDGSNDVDGIIGDVEVEAHEEKEVVDIQLEHNLELSEKER